MYFCLWLLYIINLFNKLLITFFHYQKLRIIYICIYIVYIF